MCLIRYTDIQIILGMLIVVERRYDMRQKQRSIDGCASLIRFIYKFFSDEEDILLFFRNPKMSYINLVVVY